VSRIDEVTFLRKLQRLLEEGDFVATYKFALLQALADLSVENERPQMARCRFRLTGRREIHRVLLAAAQGHIAMASCYSRTPAGRRPF
jgi:hypothetical protein